jgi:uncharacterized membrane protein YgaE (UPF0421/DUF939 family)
MNKNHYSPLIPALQLSIRAALAAGVAVAIAELFRLQYPLYAMIGAVIVSDLSPSKTRELGLQRLAGSALGAAVGAAFSQFLAPAAWAIGVSVMVAMFLSHLLHLQAAAKLSGYVCAIVLLGYSDNAWSYAFHRLIETVLGVGMAVLVSFVPKLIHIEPKQQAT